MQHFVRTALLDIECSGRKILTKWVDIQANTPNSNVNSKNWKSQSRSSSSICKGSSSISRSSMNKRRVFKNCQWRTAKFSFCMKASTRFSTRRDTSSINSSRSRQRAALSPSSSNATSWNTRWTAFTSWGPNLKITSWEFSQAANFKRLRRSNQQFTKIEEDILECLIKDFTRTSSKWPQP